LNAVWRGELACLPEELRALAMAGAVGIKIDSELSSMSLIISAMGYLAISQLLLIGLYYLGFHRQLLVARLIISRLGKRFCLTLTFTLFLIESQKDC
jgi:hypothetical protein